MARITRYSRRMKRMLVSGMTAACFVCLFAIPFTENKLLKNEVGYYSIIFNGTQIGSANSREDAEKALAEARRKFSKEYDNVVYVDSDIDIVKQSKVFTERMSSEDLQDKVYNAFFTCVTDKENATAYTVRIDDFTVTLATKEDVIGLMQMVTAKYDTNNSFQVTLKSVENNYGMYSVDMVKSEIHDTGVNTVAAPAEGDAVTEEEETDNKVQDGITGIRFEEKVSVNETLASTANIMSVEDAYNAITKEKAEKTVYVVVQGDTLSAIARKCSITLKDIYAMNEGLSEKSLIIPGDEIVVTVPKAEISVVMVVRKTYEEDYNAPVQYVDDNKAYRGQNKVISAGTTGYHRVTADVTYVNGIQSNIEYVDETVLVESQPKVIATGTLTPPRYLRPITGGVVTSNFGARWGSTHTGVDWGVPLGTEVRAAAAGTVIRASWYGNYGYCVDIRHNDGSVTRYAHLSSFIAKVGQTVSQGQPIARSGSTGRSTGPHLHFEIILNGRAVNPLNYVNKN